MSAREMLFPSSARSLHEIADEMESLTAGDPEIAHARADDLLIEALAWLRAGESRHVEVTTERLVTAWRRLPKWYA